jgi:hypothetical protein
VLRDWLPARLCRYLGPIGLAGFGVLVHFGRSRSAVQNYASVLF